MKRVPGLRDLSDDHHTGLVLARRCKQAGRADSGLAVADVWAQVREAFSLHLEPHFRIEEDALLPALEGMGESSLVERIRSDHAALRALQQSEPASRALLERFGALLEAHIRFEERSVFEPAQDRLAPRDLEAIARACAAHPRAR